MKNLSSVLLLIASVAAIASAQSKVVTKPHYKVKPHVTVLKGSKVKIVNVKKKH